MLLRFFFDAGSGVCLWAFDDEAKARFGYPVESGMLHVPQTLRDEIEQLITDYDDTFPWDDPASGKIIDPSRPIEGYRENPPFATRVKALLAKLRVALGEEFVIASDYEA